MLGKRDNQTENATISETGLNENNCNTENESEEEAPSNAEVAEANKSPWTHQRTPERVIMINLMHHKHTQILLLTNLSWKLDKNLHKQTALAAKHTLEKFSAGKATWTHKNW